MMAAYLIEFFANQTFVKCIINVLKNVICANFHSGILFTF